MKRLILIGGRPWLAKDGGKRFTDTLFRYYPKGAKLAFCIFAQPESDWPETTKVNLEMFAKHRPTKLEHRIMTLDNFAEVSAWADIIYLPGGDTSVLMEKLQPFDLAKLWDHKVVAGSSAGADMFCSGFISLSKRTFDHGLGWVQTTCIPHWRAADFEGYTAKDWDWAEAETFRQMPDLPLLCLPESDFVEITVR